MRLEPDIRGNNSEQIRGQFYTLDRVLTSPFLFTSFFILHKLIQARAHRKWTFNRLRPRCRPLRSFATRFSVICNSRLAMTPPPSLCLYTHSPSSPLLLSP
jgi:hypothetical protein